MSSINDSLLFAHIQTQIDSLRFQLRDVKIEHSFFHDILSGQSEIYNGIIALIAGLIGIVLTVSNWNYLRRPVKEAVRDVERLRGDVVEFKGSALRALYEAQKAPDWKIIHHIRYCEWFYDTNKIEGLKDDLIKIKDKEFPEVKLHSENYNYLKNKFENKEGLIKILGKIIQSNDSIVRELAQWILQEITPDKKNIGL